MWRGKWTLKFFSWWYLDTLLCVPSSDLFQTHSVFFFQKKGDQTFYTSKIKVSFFKKAIFECQKVIYFGCSDSGLSIDVWYILGKVKGAKTFFRLKKGGEDFSDKFFPKLCLGIQSILTGPLRNFVRTYVLFYFIFHPTPYDSGYFSDLITELLM